MGQVLWQLCVDVGYVMTYGAFGTDPPTPFEVGGLNIFIYPALTFGAP